MVYFNNCFIFALSTCKVTRTYWSVIETSHSVKFSQNLSGRREEATTLTSWIISFPIVGPIYSISTWALLLISDHGQCEKPDREISEATVPASFLFNLIIPAMRKLPFFAVFFLFILPLTLPEVLGHFEQYGISEILKCFGVELFKINEDVKIASNSMGYKDLRYKDEIDGLLKSSLSEDNKAYSISLKGGIPLSTGKFETDAKIVQFRFWGLSKYVRIKLVNSNKLYWIDKKHLKKIQSSSLRENE